MTDGEKIIELTRTILDKPNASGWHKLAVDFSVQLLAGAIGGSIGVGVGYALALRKDAATQRIETAMEVMGETNRI